MIDFSDYCRICATQSKHLLSLYHDVESDKPFAEMVKVCTRLSFYEFELRPKFICTSCVTKLKIAYDLYNLIQNSEETFKSIISSQMFLKSEQDDTIEDAVNTGGGFNTYNLESSMDNLIRVDGIKTECIFAEELNISSLYDETEPPITPEPTIRKKSGRSKKNDTEPLPVCNERNNDTNKPKLQFECYKCKLSLPSIVRLKVHLREHDAIRKCRICVKNFTQLEYIKHSCNGKHFKCQYCMKIFQTTHTLVKHINSNHKDHPNYKCYKCAKAFHTKELLEIHKPTHNKEQKRFICDICGACYRTRFQIKEHMESTHTDKRKFLCATCGKSFKNPTHLRAHINRHTLTKSIDCPKCPKRFFDKYGLKKHLDIHNDSQFVCDICGSVMRTRASYTEHKRRHKNTKVYTCDVCFKQIKTSKYNFQLHKYTHTGEKPFKCSYCDNRYGQSADLNKHLRKHMGPNTYKCDRCEKSFRLLRELRKHTSDHYIQSLSSKENGAIRKEIQ